jgi:hypothetical protein
MVNEVNLVIFVVNPTAVTGSMTAAQRTIHCVKALYIAKLDNSYCLVVHVS